MTTAWFLYVLLVGTLLALGARSVAAALSGRPTRWVWATALGATLVLAIVAPQNSATGRVVTLEVPAAAVVQTSEIASSPQLTDRFVAARAWLAAQSSDVLARVNGLVPPHMARVMMTVWLGASGVLLALYLIVNLRVARARRSWPRQRVHGTSVRIAPATGPAVVGVLRAEIIVPRSLLLRSADEQRLILDHEREHLRAGDHVLLGAAWLAAVLLPWHPAVWYVLARLRLAIELDCDARVLRRGVAPRAYGALLIDMAAQQGGIRMGALALTDGPTHLERRIRAMRSSRPRHALVRGGISTAVGALLVVAACEAKIPTAAEFDAMDVGAAERSAAQAGLGASGNADYFVNGRKVSATEARALTAKVIESIEVLKGRETGGRDTIMVTTIDQMNAEGRAGPTVSSTMAPRLFSKPKAQASPDHLSVVEVDSIRNTIPGTTAISEARLAEAALGRDPRTMRRRASIGSTGSSQVIRVEVIDPNTSPVRAVRVDTVSFPATGVGSVQRMSGLVPTPGAPGDAPVKFLVPARQGGKSAPLVLIDGVEATDQQLASLKGSDVVSVTMFRAGRDVQKYADSTKVSGVMLLKTRQAARP